MMGRFVMVYFITNTAGGSFPSQAKIAVIGKSSTNSKKTIPCLGLAIQLREVVASELISRDV